MVNGPILYFEQWQAVFEEASPDSGLSAEQLLKNPSVVARDQQDGVSALPGYQAVIDWWIRGGPDQNLLDRIKTYKAAKEAHRYRALQSAKYWSGFSSNLNSEQKYQNFFKVIDALAAKKTAPELQGLKFNIDDLVKVKTELQTQKSNGFMLKNYNELGTFLPGTLVDNYVSMKSGHPVDVAATITSGKAGNPEYDGIINYLKNFQPKVNAMDAIKQLVAEIPQGQKWVASVGLNKDERTALLNGIYAKATTFAENKKKSDPKTKIQTPEDAIRTATSMYIMPYDEKVQVTPAEAAEKTTTDVVKGSYPANPNATDEIEKGKAFFQDNSATLQPDSVDKLRAAVKEAIDYIASMNGTITDATVYGVASTSKVPTTYKDPQHRSLPENNQALANDRLKAITDTLTQALKESGKVPNVTVDTTKNQNLANNGPDWTGHKDANYEATYGPYRFAAGIFEIAYTTTTETTTPTQPEVNALGKWKYVIYWQKPTREIKIPSIGGGLPVPPAPTTGAICSPW